MKAALKPYPAYKDSGAAWLGSVPESWVVLPNRALFTEMKERDHADDEMLSVTITRGVIKQTALLADSSKKDSSKEDKSAYKLVLPGDVAYNKMRAWQGAIGVSGYRGIVSPAYVVLRPRIEHDSRYFHHLLRTPFFAKEAERWSYGITSDMWSLRPEHFKLIRTCLPSPDEQKAIVRFLDHADRRIRRFIRVKQNLIKLFEEEKQGIFERAITHGLDPHVRLTHSPSMWFTDVPEHWELVPFKRRVGFQEGPGIMAADFRDAGVPLLRISCLRTDPASLDGCNYLDPEMVAKKWKHFEVREGDYLLSASASTGSVALATQAVAGSIPYTGIIRLWPVSPKTFMPFVKLFIECRAFQDQIDSAKSGVGIEHFGPSHLKRMFITLPPVAEQRDIVRQVADLTAPISEAIKSARDEIALVREYRTVLSANVVTGKLDVRDAAVNLPDEPDEPDEPDISEDEGLLPTDEPGVFAEPEAALEEVEV